jgi:hypothetical protein
MAMRAGLVMAWRLARALAAERQLAAIGRSYVASYYTGNRPFGRERCPSVNFCCSACAIGTISRLRQKNSYWGRAGGADSGDYEHELAAWLMYIRQASMENQPFAWRRRIDLLGGRAEPNAPIVQIAHRVDEMGHRSSEPVELPNHKGVTLAQISQSLGESRPIAFGAGGLVLEDALTLGSGQSIALQGDFPVVG